MHTLKFLSSASDFDEGRFTHLACVLSTCKLSTLFEAVLCYSLCLRTCLLISTHEFYTGLKLFIKATCEMRADMTSILVRVEHVHRPSNTTHETTTVLLAKGIKRKCLQWPLYPFHQCGYMSPQAEERVCLTTRLYSLANTLYEA